MADEQKAPVAIRITRPYATEQEYLDREFDTLTRTSVVLLGAQPRPQGVVLRFEIVLNNGDSIVRGEGRVVGFKERAYGGEPGLSLRFTRLDARSKALVDRAATLRDARVRASTSLMGMPAVVVPKGMEVAPVPPFAISAPHAQASSPQPPAVERASSLPPAPQPRRTPPPLPSQAHVRAPSSPPPPSPAPPPPSSAADIDPDDIEIESTRVDADFKRPSSSPVQASAPVRASLPPLDEAPASAALVLDALDALDPIPEPPPRPSSSLPPRRSTPMPARASQLPPPLPSQALRPAPAKPQPPTPARSFPPPAPAAPPLTPLPRAPSASSHGERSRVVAPPPDRDALLHRLRARAGSLSHERVSEILAARSART